MPLREFFDKVDAGDFRSTAILLLICFVVVGLLFLFTPKDGKPEVKFKK